MQNKYSKTVLNLLETKQSSMGGIWLNWKFAEFFFKHSSVPTRFVYQQWNGLKEQLQNAVFLFHLPCSLVVEEEHKVEMFLNDDSLIQHFHRRHWDWNTVMKETWSGHLRIYNLQEEKNLYDQFSQERNRKFHNYCYKWLHVPQFYKSFLSGGKLFYNTNNT